MEGEPVKKCLICQRVFPLSSFNKERKTRDGLARHCRECAAKRNREVRARHGPYYYKNSDRDYDFREYSREYTAKYPERKRAANKLNNERKRGRLLPASTHNCAECGARAQEYHHPDYSEPLEVVPLCRRCHRKWHYHNEALK